MGLKDSARQTFSFKDDSDSLQSSQVESRIVIQQFQRQDGGRVAFQLYHQHRTVVFGAMGRGHLILEVGVAQLVSDDAGQLAVVERIGEAIRKHEHTAAPELGRRNVVLEKEQIELAAAPVQLERLAKDCFDAAEQLALCNSPFMKRGGERRDGLRAK